MARDIRWNYSWFPEMRNSEEAQQLCMEQANRVFSQLGPKKMFYAADVRPGKNRCHALVKTVTLTACLDNHYHNSLAKALGGSM